MRATWRVALLDDYQGVALASAAWSQLEDMEVRAFGAPFVDDGDLVAKLGEFNVIVAMRERTPFSRSTLERLPNLRLLVTTGMANASIDMPGARELGVTVTGTESLPQPVVELTWGLILAAWRGVWVESSELQSGSWQTTVGKDLAGCNLGIAGLGRIGSGVAQVGRAFGMSVRAWGPTLTAARAQQHSVEYAPDLDSLLASSDIFSIHLRLSERTSGLIDAARMRTMRPGSLLVNTSRSGIVDQAALLESLDSGHLMGAALDVFDQEPLPRDSPLLGRTNVILTPHIGYVSRSNYALFYGQALEDIQAFAQGKPLRVLNGSI